MPVLLRARAAQPAVAVGTEDVCCPLLLALRAVLEAERSGVTANILIWACLYEWQGTGILQGGSSTVWQCSQFWRAAWEQHVRACEGKHPLWLKEQWPQELVTQVLC